MKYIRTKDGVFKEEVEWICDPPLKLAVKKADTIEELCDEFVVVATDKDKPFLYELCQPINSPEFDSKEETVYGAIWTDKGLIYVAKMNESGVLELL